MYPRYEYHHDSSVAPSRHAILEDTFNAGARHPLRHMILEVAAVLAPCVGVGLVIGAFVLFVP